MNKKLTKTLLGDVCQLHRGYDLPNQNRIDGPYPVISSSGISGMHHDYKCDGENVITGRYGTIGEVYYYNGKCWPLNTALFVSNFFDNYPKYIYYFLKCTLKVDGKDKSTVPGVDRNVLHALKVSYFSDKDYQIEIASVLSCIDAKIDLNAQLCAELEAMAKTLYDYWFVQFDFPDGNGKPYRTSGGAMEWCQALGRELPKGWRPYKIGELLAPIPNTTRIQMGEYNKEGAVPIIDQSASFIAGYTNDESTLLCSESGYIVFGDHTRIVKYIRFPFARGADGTQIIDSNSPCMPNELFYQVIQSIDLTNQGYARHYKFLKDTTVIVPDEPIAQQYQKVVSPLYDKIPKIVFENVELIKLRDWLLPMLMNGQAFIH